MHIRWRRWTYSQPAVDSASGGRQLTLYLKVAIAGLPNGLVDGQGRPDPSADLVAPLKCRQPAPRRVRSQAIAQKHQGPQEMERAGPGTTTARGLNLSGSIFR